MTKRALCIGINDYPGTDADLAGCVNDAVDWAAELTRRGYKVDTLLDAQASKQHILDAVRTLVGGASPRDTIVVTFSGHGTWVPDEDRDEADKRDEALCPHDYDRGVITDDELHEAFTDRERAVRVVMISDSCHAGTVARLAAPGPLAPALGPGAPRIRFLPPSQVLRDARAVKVAERLAGAPMVRPPRPTALLFAGCQDWEYCYDAFFGGRPNGAFTFAALRALRTLSPLASFSDWYARTRDLLPSRYYPQTPRLGGQAYQRRWPALG